MVSWSRMTRHSSKNKYTTSDEAQKAAAKYTKRHGFLHRWYECDECDYWHLATVTHQGVNVLSLDALQNKLKD